MRRYIVFIAICVAFATTNIVERASAGVITDPLGDAQAGGVDQGLTALDISSLEVITDNQFFHVKLSFNPLTPIAPASAFAANSVFGVIEFDVDQNALTGFNPGFGDVFRPSIGHPLESMVR
jgi:hypothetical protein